MSSILVWGGNGGGAGGDLSTGSQSPSSGQRGLARSRDCRSPCGHHWPLFSFGESLGTLPSWCHHSDAPSWLGLGMAPLSCVVTPHLSLVAHNVEHLGCGGCAHSWARGPLQLTPRGETAAESRGAAA